jgi:hypothetical protein
MPHQMPREFLDPIAAHLFHQREMEPARIDDPVSEILFSRPGTFRTVEQRHSANLRHRL